MSIETWRDGYQRGFLDGVQMREKLDEEQEHKLIKSRLENLAEMREEWDSDENIGYVADNWQVIYKKRAAEVNDQYDYYRAGMTKTFDEVVFPDSCQECQGDCKVCEEETLPSTIREKPEKW